MHAPSFIGAPTSSMAALPKCPPSEGMRMKKSCATELAAIIVMNWCKWVVGNGCEKRMEHGNGACGLDLIATLLLMRTILQSIFHCIGFPAQEFYHSIKITKIPMNKINASEMNEPTTIKSTKHLMILFLRSHIVVHWCYQVSDEPRQR